MSTPSIGLIAVGVLLAVAGLVNHYAIHANPVAHTSTGLIGLGGILLIVGLAMGVMNGNKARA